ncbi:MAG: hypothetical protein KA257_09105 [Opitutaceae bacterium]|nr:hypothetical protein [Opitutaceae bacterium]MBP9913189.1 hypothetical protein [Opitutaceae bacterium]
MQNGLPVWNDGRTLGFYRAPMNSLARLLGLSALLLLLFVAAAFGTQVWLKKQSARLQTEATATRRLQFHKAVELAHLGPPPWTQTQLMDLGGTIDAVVTLQSPQSAPPAARLDYLTFSEPLRGANGVLLAQAVVSFPVPPLLRLHLAHARTWLLLLVFAIGVVLLFIIASVLWLRPATDFGGTRNPWVTARGQMQSLEQLARTSVAQGSALVLERDAHQRTEQDLLLNQRLLNRSLEEKICLGRDLHDGLIQSLYAVGLTLESIRPLLSHNPAEADRRLGQCLENLNGTIREVRSYITDLSAEKLSRVSFAAGVELLMQELSGGREVALNMKVDEDAAAALTPAQITETLQITREAISNGLRHGQATAITVRLHKSNRELGLLIHDNGHGFIASARSDTGHGLNNMEARAQQIGATLRIDSRPGDGTRVVMTLPSAAS